jgi:hypothetical protein
MQDCSDGSWRNPRCGEVRCGRRTRGEEFKIVNGEGGPPPQQKYYANAKENSPPHPPAHITDSSTTVACNMSGTYSEVEKRIQQAVDEMRALESAPVITDFVRQYDVPYNRLYRRFHETRAKSNLVPENRRFLDVEKAVCRYLDKLGLLSVSFFEGWRTTFSEPLDASLYR